MKVFCSQPIGGFQQLTTEGRIGLLAGNVPHLLIALFSNPKRKKRPHPIKESCFPFHKTGYYYTSDSTLHLRKTFFESWGVATSGAT